MTKDDFIALARQAAEEYGLRPELLLALLEQESQFNPKAGSPKGAKGIAQFMPATAKELGIDPMDPMQAIPAAARYLKAQLEQFGSEALALAAYNAGMGNVKKFGGIPPFEETENYVTKILRNSGGTFASEDLILKPDPQAPLSEQPEQPGPKLKAQPEAFTPQTPVANQFLNNPAAMDALDPFISTRLRIPSKAERFFNPGVKR